MPHSDRDRFLGLIRENIAESGVHITLVQGGQSPRWAYTIGLTEAGHPELVLAGGTSLLAADAQRVLNHASAASLAAPQTGSGWTFEVEEIGEFSIAPVDATWARELLRGAFDYYEKDVAARQIVPEGLLRTIDVPDLARPYDPATARGWEWLFTDWALDLPTEAVAFTNLEALRGEPITEAARWEPDEWELFAGFGPDVDQDDVRVVPLWTLLAADETLSAVTELSVGEALHRRVGEEWQEWKARG